MVKRLLNILSLLTCISVIPALASVSDDADSLWLSGSRGSATMVNRADSGLPDPTVITRRSKERSFHYTGKVTSGSRMNLESGQSIVLKPGTMVFAGGYLRATILPESSAQQPGIRHKIKSKKPVVAEQPVQPIIVAETRDANGPFMKNSRGRAIGESNNNSEWMSALAGDASGVSFEQNRKPIGFSATRMNFSLDRIAKFCSAKYIVFSEKPETSSVLRL